tara:strand:- start:157 stop:786 length:630 start_codon:yes stop_codon:yes gene_type:complete
VNTYISLAALLILSCCSSPDKYSSEWWEDKLSDPSWEHREVFKDLAQNMKDEADLLDKYSINAWLNNNDFTINKGKGDTQLYLKTLKLCAANFAVLYGFAEAGKVLEENLLDIDDKEELNMLSQKYMNHGNYFYTRAFEIETHEFDSTNWESEEISYYDIKDAAIEKEITKIRDEIFSINSDLALIDLLEGNEEICYMVRRQNPNNQNY